MSNSKRTMQQILAAANSVIPVVTLDHATDAGPLADVLVPSGFKVLEITLRTEAGLDAIAQLASSHPQVIVGAGTVLTADQAVAATKAGASFLVSPGFSDAVHRHCQTMQVPYLPGVATVTEAMSAAAHGYSALKLFPANIAGGPSMLKALYSVLPDLCFCPTGGVDAASLAAYLALPNVPCIGGSWLAPDAMIRDSRWDEIRALASNAASEVA